MTGFCGYTDINCSKSQGLSSSEDVGPFYLCARLADPPYHFFVTCAWCGKRLDVVETHDPKVHGQISHGICKDCGEILKGSV